MKNVLLLIGVILDMTVPSCFAQNSTDTIYPTLKVNDQSIGDTLKISDPLFEVFNAYLGIKNSLAKDDGEEASMDAKFLFKMIGKVRVDKLTQPQYAIWMKYYEKLSYDVEHIKGTMDIEHQREHFVSLSKTMYAIMKSFNTNTAYVYYQFCPMANEGKGAFWLSEMEKTSNPYMGKKMPGCGSIKDTIKVKQ